MSKNYESTEKSKDSDGTHVTRNHSDGSSEVRTYHDGKLVDITHRESDGSSHSHDVGHGIFGPFKGSKR